MCRRQFRQMASPADSFEALSVMESGFRCVLGRHSIRPATIAGRRPRGGCTPAAKPTWFDVLYWEQRLHCRMNWRRQGSQSGKLLAFSRKFRFARHARSAGAVFDRRIHESSKSKRGRRRAAVLRKAFQQAMAHAAKEELHVDTEAVPLAGIEDAWQFDHPGRRLAIINSA